MAVVRHHVCADVLLVRGGTILDLGVYDFRYIWIGGPDRLTSSLVRLRALHAWNDLDPTKVLQSSNAQAQVASALLNKAL